MAPRTQPQTFRRLQGFPRIIQGDGLTMLRCIYIGSLVADRDFYRIGRPGMGVDDFDRIQDPIERAEYIKICNTLKNAARTPNTQTKGTIAFFTALGLDPHRLTSADLPTIQDKLSERYRIVFANYHTTTELCFISWSGPVVRPRVIYLVSDGIKWDALSTPFGIYGKFFCPGCLKPSHCANDHRCEHTCTSCSSLLVEGNCNDGQKISCDDCNFTFKSQKCFDHHKHVPSRPNNAQNRCDSLKLCLECNTVYRTSVGPHVCGQSIFCQMCKEYTNNEHDCSWEKFTDADRQRMLKKQKEYRYAFYDIETTQCTEREDGEFDYGEHFCTTISLCKVCYKCEDSSMSEPCTNCGDRMQTFQYQDVDESKYKVVDDFVDWLMKEPTMKGRTIFAHNGGRFDQHLVLKGFHRRGVYPSTVDKGSTLIRVEVKLRDRRIIFKDSFRIIPMALSAFPKAFSLDCDEKGQFPHLANQRKYWFKKWDSIPPKKYFGYKFMKPDQQASFDEWHKEQEGKEWNQPEELTRYCEKDVEIVMKGCLQYRKTMITHTGWCPLTTANTLAAFCLFQLRVDHLNGLDMPYLPENGFGGVNQSIFALKYIKWRESKLERQLHHALSPLGEMRIPVGKHNFSVDCFDPLTKNILEVLGCVFHGCPKCYPRGAKLIGGERAEELYERTMKRIELIKTKFPNVEIKWECEIKEELKDKKNEMKKFFDDEEITTRLRMRDALFGGRVEVLRSFLKATMHTVLKYYDICSLYPSVQSMREYPIGRPEVITINFKQIVGNKFPYRGLVKLRVLAPSSLELAVLPYRYEKALFFTLCADCVPDKTEYCTHNDRQRSWIGTYATVEIELALEKGYKVLKIFEVWHWDKWSGEIYRNYFKKFMRLKFAASGFPAEVGNDAQKQKEYCERIGAKLGFELLPEDVVEDSALRTVCKLCNNSGWGKLAESPDHLKTEYIKASEFYTLMMDASKVVTKASVVEKDDEDLPVHEDADESTESDDDEDEEVMLVTYRQKSETIRCNRFSAVHHAVFVTAYARVLLYRIVETVGKRAAYMDTDSIVFEMDRDEPDPLGHLLTGELGDLSDEIPHGWELDEAVFAGCKNYSMKIKNKETEEEMAKTAFRGFTKDANTLSLLNHQKIYDMVIKKEPEYVDITRPELKRKLGEGVHSEPRTKRYRPVSFKRATRGEGEVEIKVPFGYRE